VAFEAAAAAGFEAVTSRPLSIKDAEIRTIYDLLDLLRVRPGMWIGVPSITRLDLFIAGFRVGIHSAHASLEDEAPPFQEFHDWITASIGRHKNGHGWSDMLLEACGDEQAAFDRFWIELDAFRLAATTRVDVGN
jgi:hypothetical protein